MISRTSISETAFIQILEEALAFITIHTASSVSFIWRFQADNVPSCLLGQPLKSMKMGTFYMASFRRILHEGGMICALKQGIMFNIYFM